MPVKFQKYVMVSNPRLECLYWLVCAVLFAVLVAKFVELQEYYEFYDVGQYIHVSMWPHVTPTPQLPSVYDAQATMCAGLEGACSPPCNNATGSGRAGDCVYSEQIGLSISEDEVIFATSITREHLGSGTSATSYLPYENAETLRFSYSMAVPSRETSSTMAFRREETGWGDTLYSFNRDHQLTVILNHDGAIYRVEDEPGNYIVLTMREMLQLAGLGPDWLDEVQPTSGLRGDSNAIGRLTGIRLALSVVCYDRGSHRQFSSMSVKEKVGEFQADKYCFVTIIPSPERSTRLDSMLGVDTVQSMHGIHIVARTGGQWSRFNPISVYDALVDAFVLFAIPKLFAVFVATRLLGHLSKIYFKFIFEVFDIAEQVAGTAVRFMSNTVSFEELCDEHHGVGTAGSKTLTKDTMHRRIAAAIDQSDSLNEAELTHFVDFSHKAIVDIAQFTKHDALTASIRHDALEVARSVRHASTLSDHHGTQNKSPISSFNVTDIVDNNDVDIGSFITACSSIDKVTIQDTVKLFSEHRDVGRLERFFMPRYIRMLIQRSQLAKWTPSISRNKNTNDDIDLRCRMVSATSLTSDLAHQEHATHGTKAFRKVMHLEERHKEFEEFAKDGVRHSELEQTIRTLLFPHESEENEGAEEDQTFASLSVSAQSGNGFLSGSADSLEVALRGRESPQLRELNPADMDQTGAKRIRDMVLSRRDVEKHTASAVAQAREEVLAQVAELVSAAVQDARNLVLQEVDRAIETAVVNNAKKSPVTRSVQLQKMLRDSAGSGLSCEPDEGAPPGRTLQEEKLKAFVPVGPAPGCSGPQYHSQPLVLGNQVGDGRALGLIDALAVSSPPRQPSHGSAVGGAVETSPTVLGPAAGAWPTVAPGRALGLSIEPRRAPLDATPANGAGIAVPAGSGSSWGREAAKTGADAI